MYVIHRFHFNAATFLTKSNNQSMPCIYAQIIKYNYTIFDRGYYTVRLTNLTVRLSDGPHYVFCLSVCASVCK